MILQIKHQPETEHFTHLVMQLHVVVILQQEK